MEPETAGLWLRKDENGDRLDESCAVRKVSNGERCLGEKCLTHVSSARSWYGSEGAPHSARGKAAMIRPWRSLPRSKASSSGAPLFRRGSRD
ncbi:hypothetical protein TRIP_B330025 [uncultured Desulfatiglans sp.]|nr:hypothetical protein TRIP_B330025 [uncultured Desulfatiglans sp.]